VSLDFLQIFFSALYFFSVLGHLDREHVQELSSLDTSETADNPAGFSCHRITKRSYW